MLFSCYQQQSFSKLSLFPCLNNHARQTRLLLNVTPCFSNEYDNTKTNVTALTVAKKVMSEYLGLTAFAMELVDSIWGEVGGLGRRTGGSIYTRL